MSRILVCITITKTSLAEELPTSRQALNALYLKEYLNSFALNVMAKTRSDLTTPLNIYNTAKPYITTDIDLNKVTFFAVTALRGGMNELNMENVPGEVKEGKDFAEFYVNEKEFFELFLKLYYTEVR